jgi:hypothetical protein
MEKVIKSSSAAWDDSFFLLFLESHSEFFLFANPADDDASKYVVKIGPFVE